MRPKGQIIVEALGTLFLIVLSVGFNYELARRTQLEGLLHHVAFIYTRALKLNAGTAQAKKMANTVLRDSFETVPKALSHVRYSSKTLKDGTLVGKGHIRFPAFFRFPKKHHYEITASCRF